MTHSIEPTLEVSMLSRILAVLALFLLFVIVGALLVLLVATQGGSAIPIVGAVTLVVFVLALRELDLSGARPPLYDAVSWTTPSSILSASPRCQTWRWRSTNCFFPSSPPGSLRLRR